MAGQHDASFKRAWAFLSPDTGVSLPPATSKPLLLALIPLFIHACFA
jgi:hypothetical protein